MNRLNRVLKLLVLLAVVLIGVGLWITRTPPSEDADWVSNPFGNPTRDTATPAPAPPPAAAPEPEAVPPTRVPEREDTAAAAARPAPVRVVRMLTTPESVAVGAMTSACRETLQRRGPWKDAAAGKPWPECVDGSGRPMVVQFCSYLLLSSGRWVASDNTRDAPRCRAELPEIRRERGATVSR